MSSTEPSFTELDYIANWAYQEDSRNRGLPTGARWWCLREELRERWRRIARAHYLQWAQDEQRQSEVMRG